MQQKPLDSHSDEVLPFLRQAVGAGAGVGSAENTQKGGRDMLQIRHNDIDEIPSEMETPLSAAELMCSSVNKMFSEELSSELGRAHLDRGRDSYLNLRCDDTREEDTSGNEKEYWQKLFDQMFVIVSFSVFLVCVVGLFWARNFK